MADEEELRRVFDLYDTDRNGTLDRAEVDAALSRLGLPSHAADDTWRRLDRDGDGRVSFAEFSMGARELGDELRDLFAFIDADGNGAISAEELKSAFVRLRLAVSDPQAVDRLFAELDRDGNGLVSFAEFSALFSLLRPTDLLRHYSRNSEDAIVLADLRSLTGRPLDRRTTHLTPVQVDLARMALGGVSAVVAQLCVQPIETLKVRMQNSGTSGSFFANLRAVTRNEGIASLWKGTGPASLREMSYSTLRFGLYAPIKKAVFDGPGKEPLWAKIVSGGAAGGIGSAIATPLDLLKTQAQASVAKKSATQLVREIVSRDGVLGLWKGMSTTVSRAVVIGSVKLASYDEVKHSLTALGVAPGSMELIVGASIATGLLVSVTSAPIDFARTRLMSGTLPDGQRYRSGFHVLRTQPVRHWFRGFFPQWARIAPYTVIQFAVWEKTCKALGFTAV